jgi:hypothetical protein
VTLDLLKETGTPIDRQGFNWRELAGAPISKLDDDAFTRVRIILMNGLESEMNRFLHACARMNEHLQKPLALVRRVDQHQQTLINWLIGADHSPLETTLGFEQVAIEVTAAIAQQEPDPYLAQVFRFGLLEDFDHMYRFAALYDRLEGKDANNITQCYTDIRPGRPTKVEHRYPLDDLRRPYDRTKAAPITKLNALTIMSAENQTHDYYMNIGPQFADPVARQLYAEIASIEEQHTTQYESIISPEETWIEKWLMHECMEIYNYYSCASQESNPRIKKIWERFCDYELGHLHFAIDIARKAGLVVESLLPDKLPDPVKFASQREFVRRTLEAEVGFSANGTEIVQSFANEGEQSRIYRETVNSAGSPSETVAQGYCWTPGTELARRVAIAEPDLGLEKEVRS